MNNKQLTTTLESSLQTAPLAAKAALLHVLAARGEVAAVAAAFTNGDAQTKNAVIKALAANYSPEAAGALYTITQISGGSNAHAVADAYIIDGSKRFYASRPAIIIARKCCRHCYNRGSEKAGFKRGW